MRIIAKRTLKAFWESSPSYLDAKGPLEAWHHLVSKAEWENPSDIKAQFRNASFLKGNRVVFNIAGNKYRLITKINYPYRVVYIRFIGNHTQYNHIDAEAI